MPDRSIEAARVLPAEPTRAMLDAWWDTMRGVGRHRPSTVWKGLHYSDHESLMVDAYQAMLKAAPTVGGDSKTFHAIAWGDRIRDEQLDELLARAEKAQRVVLRIDQFRDLVLQAKADRPEVDAIDAARYRALCEQNSIRMPRILPPFREDPDGLTAYNDKAAIDAAIDAVRSPQAAPT